MKKIKYLFASLFLFICNIVLYAEADPDFPDADADDYGQAETEGAPATPIDMYEGMLLGIALLMIVGYYLYSRNRRIANS